MSAMTQAAGRHRQDPGPVPYFQCPCGWSVGFKRDSAAFGFANFFGVEPDLDYMPKVALEEAERAVEQHEAEAH